MTTKITRTIITSEPANDDRSTVRVCVASRQSEPVRYVAAAEPPAAAEKPRILSSADLVRLSVGHILTAEQCLRITEAARRNGLPTPYYHMLR